MTSVERARKFVQTRGKAIALAILPLASLAIAGSQPAKAVNVLVFNSGSCVVSSSGVVSTPTEGCLNTPIPGFQNGANSLKLSGTATVTASSGGQGELLFSMTGTANGGTPNSELPLSWDFTVSSNQQFEFAGYELGYFFNINDNGGNDLRGKVKGGPLTFSNCGDFQCAHVTGTDHMQLDVPVFSYIVQLRVIGYDFNQGTFLSINVPENSIDVNPQVEVDAQAPEPASLALGATGLLGLMIARFRRRKV